MKKSKYWKAGLHTIWDNQHHFAKSKSCMTNSMASYNGVITPVDEGRAMDVIWISARPLTWSPQYLWIVEVGIWCVDCLEDDELVEQRMAGDQLTVCAQSPESQSHPGLHLKKHDQQIKRGDSVHQLSWETPHLDYCIQVQGPSTRKTWTCWNRCKGRPQKRSESWGISPES